MLEIDMEFRKGILFVRLLGSLTKDTVNTLDKEVTDIVKKYELVNVVFNIAGLDELDMLGINALLKNYKLTNNYHGKAVVCGISNNIDIKRKLKNSKILNYMYETSDELSAIKKINT